MSRQTGIRVALFPLGVLAAVLISLGGMVILAGATRL